MLVPQLPLFPPAVGNTAVLLGADATCRSLTTNRPHWVAAPTGVLKSKYWTESFALFPPGQPPAGFPPHCCGLVRVIHACARVASTASIVCCTPVRKTCGFG